MNRLELAKYLLDVSTQAVRLKQLLLKDQLRNAVVKAVHVKQYAETERGLTEAVAGLIKRQFEQASKSVSEKGGTKFDPRDWDNELIDTCLPILMRKAGEAAAAQMLIMGVDVAPKKKVGKTEKGDLPGHPFRGNQWGGGRRQTDTPEFKAWFGDSKVVDENGDPMVVFHGTTSEFTSFDSSAPRSTDPGFFGRGIYFSPDPSVASNYAAGLGVGEEKPGGNVMPVYIRMVKPLEVDRGKGLQAAMKKAGMKPSYQPDADTAILKEHGYDGVMVYMKSRGEKGPGELTEIIAFDPSQIKSATGNRGTFDPKDPDMNKSPSFTSIKTTATDWLTENAELADDLLWPEVFTLPSGAVIDMGFATEWPAWMKTEISQQMKETFEQPFWAGINDTTAAGIQHHVERGLLDGLSIREIQQQMVGDGLDEYYHNRGQNIARTESGSALNGARSAAMDRLAEEVPGLRVKRTWMSVLGTTTRSTHASLDGVPADRDGGWYLGGVHVPWPAHWNLPAGERCFCQCTIVQSWGQSDETALELIEEYNERLAEERSLRRLWEKTEKGDLLGHPFRGNQWSGGSGESLSKEELDAVEYWSASHENVAEIRNGGGPHHDAFMNALDKSPKYDGVSYRGLRDVDSSEFQIGKEIELDSLTSSSKRESLAARYAAIGSGPGVLLEIHGKTGADISELGGRQDKNREVIHKPGSRFRVVGVDYDSGSDLHLVRLEEIEKKSVKGDRPGHPFRGNQWGWGRTGAESGGSTDHGVDAALAVLEGRQPVNAATSVRKIDQTSVKSDRAMKGEGANVARVVEIEDADGVTRKYCFKPDDGENPGVHPAFFGHQSVNEVAGSVIDEAMGLGMVARTEMAEIGGKKGSLQEWINDDATRAIDVVDWNADGTVKSRERLDKAEGIEDMMYFDALTGNTDRHLGNYLVKDNKIRLIDNGMSMADNVEYGDPKLRYRTMEHAGPARAMKRMTPKFKAALEKLIDDKDAVDAKLRESGVGAAQRQSFWKRAEYIRRAGMLGFGDSTMRDLGRLSEGGQLFASFSGAELKEVDGRPVLEIDLKGDLPGHPFRGNQWSVNPRISDSMKGLSKDAFFSSKDRSKLLENGLNEVCDDLGLKTKVRVVSDQELNQIVGKAAKKMGANPSDVMAVTLRNSDEVLIRSSKVSKVGTGPEVHPNDTHRMLMQLVFHEIGHAYDFQRLKSVQEGPKNISQYDNDKGEEFADLFGSRLGAVYSKVNGMTLPGRNHPLNSGTSVSEFLESTRL